MSNSVTVTRRFSRLLLVATTLWGCGGCGSQLVLRPDQPTALLQTHMDNDSQHAFNSNYYTIAFPDAPCKDGKRFQSKPAAGRSYTSPASPIPAGTPFLATMNYLEGSMSEIRGCLATFEFVPVAGRSYRVDLHLRNDAHECSLNLVDTTSGADQPTPFTLPPNACLDKVVRPSNPFVGRTLIHVQVTH